MGFSGSASLWKQRTAVLALPNLFLFPPTMPADNADNAEKSVPSRNAVENQEGDKVQGTLQSRRLYLTEGIGLLQVHFFASNDCLINGTFTLTDTSGIMHLD